MGQVAKSRKPAATPLSDELLTALPFGVITYRSDGRCLSANEAAAQLIGLPLARVLAQNLQELALWEKVQLLADAESTLASGLPLERQLPVSTASGEIRWIDCRLGRVSVYGEPCLVLTLAEGSERKRAEEVLQAAKDHAENLIQTAPTMVVGLDRTGRIQVFNQAAEKTTGYTSAELEGRDWFEVICPRDRYPQVWAVFEHLETGDLPSTSCARMGT